MKRILGLLTLAWCAAALPLHINVGSFTTGGFIEIYEPQKPVRTIALKDGQITEGTLKFTQGMSLRIRSNEGDTFWLHPQATSDYTLRLKNGDCRNGEIISGKWCVSEGNLPLDQYNVDSLAAVEGHGLL